MENHAQMESAGPKSRAPFGSVYEGASALANLDRTLCVRVGGDRRGDLEIVEPHDVGLFR